MIDKATIQTNHISLVGLLFAYYILMFYKPEGTFKKNLSGKRTIKETAQVPNLDMEILYVLVHAVLICVGQSTPWVECKIVNPPIIFGKTAALSCVAVTSRTSYTKQHVTSWFGGRDNAIMTYTGTSADHTKYEEIWRRRRGSFESILIIFKFDENDVNVDYSYSLDNNDYKRMLSLVLDKFEYHPDKDTTTVLASFKNGYLDVNMTISKVYPIPRCTMMFNKKIIVPRLTAHHRFNGIFYRVVERVNDYFDVCSGQLIVTCIVGNTTIPIHQESFNRCTKTKGESLEYSDKSIISFSVGVLLFAILVIGMSCLAKYRQLKNVLCCRNIL